MNQPNDIFGEIRMTPGGRSRVLRLNVAGIHDAAGDADASTGPADSMLLTITDGHVLPLGLKQADTLRPTLGDRALCGSFEILAVGRAKDVDRHPGAARAEVTELPGHVLIPGLVNAHAHLDLTHMGPREFDRVGGFATWMSMVRLNRAQSDEEIAASVDLGITLSMRAGTVAVGDIAGANASGPNLTPIRRLRRSPLRGVSFLEFFAIGSRESQGLARLDTAVRAGMEEGLLKDSARIRLGLQPHAPSTVSLAAYIHAAGLGNEYSLPLATHAAESLAEHELIAEGQGPLREFLEQLGLWNKGLEHQLGAARSPIEHLGGVLAHAPFLLAHVNDASDSDLDLLIKAGQGVVYCPRSSAYFGNDVAFGPHRYREMLARRMVVALGTDSIINLPAGRCGAESGGIGVLDEMRLLYRRDGTDPSLLLRMGTLNGAAALGLPGEGFAFVRGASPLGIVAVKCDGSSLGCLLASAAPPCLLLVQK